MENKATLLEMRNIDKSFPGVYALKEVDFVLESGQVHILLGENGAGKSTLIKILAGIYQSDSGEILLEGSPTVIPDARTGRDLGISVIYQELNLVPDLSVAKNIYLGREPVLPGFLKKVDWEHVERESREVMKRLDVDIDILAPVRSLSVADQQMVEIARALAFDCKILVMDEPTSSLSGHEIHELFNAVARLREQGVGIIYRGFCHAQAPSGELLKLFNSGGNHFLRSTGTPHVYAHCWRNLHRLFFLHVADFCES